MLKVGLKLKDMVRTCEIKVNRTIGHGSIIRNTQITPNSCRYATHIYAFLKSEKTVWRYKLSCHTEGQHHDHSNASSAWPSPRQPTVDLRHYNNDKPSYAHHQDALIENVKHSSKVNEDECSHQQRMALKTTRIAGRLKKSLRNETMKKGNQ